MASIDTSSHSSSHVRLGEALTAPFRAVWWFLVSIAENNAKLKEFERLSAMSDQELAKRGLTREDLVHRVFIG